uniref:Uncharacterized protein n=1 Tax=Meloidogyne floridensis TaxID=298350 RepID=A0A915NV72_9BILA
MNLEKGIELKNKLKNTSSNDDFQLPKNKDSKKYKNNIKKQLIKRACEATTGIIGICDFGFPLNCYSLSTALGIFSIELFAYSILDEDFDEFVGKWPSNIYFYNNEEIKE